MRGIKDVLDLRYSDYSHPTIHQLPKLSASKNVITMLIATFTGTGMKVVVRVTAEAGRLVPLRLTYFPDIKTQFIELEGLRQVLCLAQYLR